MDKSCVSELYSGHGLERCQVAAAGGNQVGRSGNRADDTRSVIGVRAVVRCKQRPKHKQINI